jgi:hypothetical protein
MKKWFLVDRGDWLLCFLDMAESQLMSDKASSKSLQILLESVAPDTMEEFGCSIRVGIANMTLSDQLLRIVSVTGVDEFGGALPSSFSALKMDVKKNLTGTRVEIVR